MKEGVYQPYDPLRVSNNPEGKPPRRSTWAKGKRFVTTVKKQVPTAAAIIAVLALVLLIGSVAWVKPQATPIQPSPTIHTQPTTAKPDAYTAFRAKYGPWHIADNDAITANVAILKQNGTREDSIRSVTIDASWASAPQMVDFRATARNGSTIRVQTPQGVVYTLSQGQAFIIEDRPETLYGITATLQFVQKTS